MRKYELGEVQVTKRGRLPHWQAQHAVYFITWTLVDALPAVVLARLRAERDAEVDRIYRNRGSVTASDRNFLELTLIKACQDFLDEHSGECILRDRGIAELVSASLLHFDEQRYLLYAWCVMPNHVHVVLSCLGEFDISSILHSLKGFSSKEINKRLGRTGSRWQKENFDRCIRDSTELQRTIDYVASNPLKAALTDWPFVRTYPERIAALL